MAAMGIEIQNRCEAIKQNYTSIFDDESNHFWVVVPLTIFAAATAQTSLVPLLFIAGMFFLGLLTSNGGSGNSSYEEHACVNPRLNFLISRFESEAASSRENIYRRSLLRLYDDTELELIRDSALGESDRFSAYRLACNLGDTQHTCNAFVVVIHRRAAYVELQGRDSVTADLDWLIVLDPYTTSVSLGWDNPVTAAALEVLHRKRTYLFGSLSSFSNSRLAEVIKSEIIESALKGK